MATLISLTPSHPPAATTMASSPPSKPSKSRRIKAPAEKLTRWARDIFSSSPLPSRSSTPAGSITPAAFQQPPGLSTSVSGSVQPGLSNDSASLRPSVFDKYDDGSITTTESQKPGLSVTTVLLWGHLSPTKATINLVLPPNLKSCQDSQRL